MHQSKHSTKKSVTSKDVATAAGVSQALVSTVLNGSKNNIGASAEVRRRILETAVSMGYHANPAARAIISGRFGNVALLLGDKASRNFIPGALFDGIVDTLKEAGDYLSIVRLSDEDLSQSETIPNVLSHVYADGLLVNYNYDVPHEVQENIVHYRVPAIWINSVHMSKCVFPDDADAANRLVDHFLSAGKRRIAYVAFPGKHHSVTRRREGYLQAMAAAGLPPLCIDLKLGQPVFLKKDALPEVILAYATKDLQYVCDELVLRGVLPGRDIQVGTIADAPFLFLGRKHPTVVLPQYKIGVTAVHELMKCIADVSYCPSPCVLRGTLQS